MTVDHLLIFNLGLTYSIFIVYNYFQQNLISLDPLTKINNRETIGYLFNNENERKSSKKIFIYFY